MGKDIYPKYQLPSGGWTTDQEHADRLWAKHEAKQARQTADIAAHMAMRLVQVGERLTAKHPKAAKDGELAAMLSDLRDHITVLRVDQS